MKTRARELEKNLDDVIDRCKDKYKSSPSPLAEQELGEYVSLERFVKDKSKISTYTQFFAREYFTPKYDFKEGLHDRTI